MSETNKTDNINRLASLLEGFEVTMMTTHQLQEAGLHSRPMMTQKTPFDGSLWFFTRNAYTLVDEIRAQAQVNLAYSDAATFRFISISGSAYVIPDRLQMEKLWDETYRAWVPQGLDDPDLVLLRVDVTSAEVWDAASQAHGDLLQIA